MADIVDLQASIQHTFAMLNYPKPDGESWIWSTADPSHNFRRGCTKQILAEHVTVNQALIFYGKFQEHISGCVQNFKHPSYHYSSVSREINFTGEKTSAHVSGLIILQVKEDEGKAWEWRIPSSSAMKEKSPGLDCCWTVTFPPHAHHCSKERPYALASQDPCLKLSSEW